MTIHEMDSLRKRLTVLQLDRAFWEARQKDASNGEELAAADFNVEQLEIKIRRTKNTIKGMQIAQS